MITILDRWVGTIDYGPYHGEKTYIRSPTIGDWLEWAELRSGSRDFLEKWEPTWSKDALTHKSYRFRLHRNSRDARDEKGFAFFIFREKDGTLLGGINVSNIVRGVSMSCSIGYWIGASYARSGYMTDALQVALRFIFVRLRLHRVEASCIPSNIASSALLRKNGFHLEGYARQYLNINGQWNDHLLFSMLCSDQREARHDQPLRRAEKC